MIKTKIVETTEKFDVNGKLIERIVREETTEDDETRYPVVTPVTTPNIPNPWWKEPYCYSTNITCGGIE